MHDQPSQSVLMTLKTNDQTGLDAQEASRRLQQHGPNVLTQKKGHSSLVRFLLQFHQPLIYILLVAGFITGWLGEWVDSSAILGVVLLNAIVGFLQEHKAIRAIEALSKMLLSEATVLRNGTKARIPSEQLVPGDIVFLQSGDRVPADLRLIRVKDLQVGEAALTGESVPVEKNTDVLPAGTGLPDRTNMAFSSSLVTYGTAAGVVVATGDNTEIGRISQLLENTDVLATPLTRKMAKFSNLLLYAILALAGLTFVAGVIRGESWLDMFMAAVALAVGAIPEGLPAAITITLAIGVSRMARRHAIIRQMPAVETLGSTTVICSDKTGTLTENQMTVLEIWTQEGDFRVTGVGYQPEGRIEPANGASLGPNSVECLRAGLLCNDSRVVRNHEGWKVEGDPTEAALLVSAAKAGLKAEQETSRLPRIDTVPFESQHQYMATLHRDGDAHFAYVKGSIESLLPRCGNIEAKRIHTAADAMAAKGLRVLLFARKKFPQEMKHLQHDHIREGLEFLGLQGMIDPPRDEAIRSVAVCRNAGIQVKMITGDHAITAQAIAKRIGIPAESVITGHELAEAEDERLREIVSRTSVFARVSPEQKLRLVQALQANHHIVAMTGDGVNDAPALKRANIGVAMGITGTDVSKEAAAMVLTDDNFASIHAAVEEGRGVYDNLVKFITWTLPTNLGEGLVILTAVFAGIALPILPVQILWINMTTALLLGLTLAMEPKEAGLMDRQPRDPKTPILTRELGAKIVLVGILLLAGAFGLFKYEILNGSGAAEARTVAVNVFVIGELFYLLNCRSLTRSFFSIPPFSNPWLIGGVTLMLLLQLAFTYLPFMNMLFHSAPIRPESWLWIFGTGVVIFAVIEIEKKVRHRRK